MTSDNSSRDIRNLWQGQGSESFSMTIEELRAASAKFTRKIYWRNVREYLAGVIVVCGYGYYIYRFHNLVVRLGAALVIAATLWVTYRIYKKGSPTAMTAGMDGQSCIDFHRGELVRQRDLLSTVWSWYLLPFIPGLAVFFGGMIEMALAKPGARQRLGGMAVGYGIVFAVCIGVFVFLGWVNGRAAKKLQRRIDALDNIKHPDG